MPTPAEPTVAKPNPSATRPPAPPRPTCATSAFGDSTSEWCGWTRSSTLPLSRPSAIGSGSTVIATGREGSTGPTETWAPRRAGRLGAAVARRDAAPGGPVPDGVAPGGADGVGADWAGAGVSSPDWPIGGGGGGGRSGCASANEAADPASVEASAGASKRGRRRIVAELTRRGTRHARTTKTSPRHARPIVAFLRAFAAYDAGSAAGPLDQSTQASCAPVSPASPRRDRRGPCIECARPARPVEESWRHRSSSQGTRPQL